MKIKNIEAVAERIRLAVKNGERILLYGDSDMDGISSVVVLETAINAYGGKVDAVCFPARETDGYGLNANGLNFLKDKVPALLITLDLGIGNVKETDMANEMGFEVVIVDHHQPPSPMPNASIIVDPFQPGDDYPFKGFANVGLAYVLSLELLRDKVTPELKNNLMELAALGTIADMVPQTDMNLEMINGGLASLPRTTRPALRAFLDIIGRRQESASQIISALNAAESEHFQNRSYKLLMSDSFQECENLAQELIGKVRYKQDQVRSITEEVERRISRNPSQTIIFEGDPSWKLILAGSVASNLVRKYQKPIFIFKRMDDESTGSIRAPQGTNVVEAMKTCSDLLITFGGHPVAAGFRCKNENLEKFKEHLIEYFKSH
jgi:single-stranded-DNA-specific exonuclease